MASSCGRPKRTVKPPGYYRQLSDERSAKSPKRKRADQSDTLYPVTVLEDDGSRYRVHYVGYSDSYDEWKDYSDVEARNDCDVDEGDNTPFSLYRKLANKIKASLKSGRKESPIVKIEMPFDRITFDGGLGLCGVKQSYMRGSQRYTISTYKKLNHLLGVDWHVRGINENGDFCYVILNTLVFYLYHHRPLVEYAPTSVGTAKELKRDCGHALVFSFVRGDGTPERFGNDSTIFCN